MKKNILLPAFIAVMGLAIVMGASAFQDFTKAEAKKPAKPATEDNVYFQYGGPNESDANLRNPDYWTEITGLPENNPCTPGLIVCVSHLDDATLQSQSGTGNKAKFMTYLNSVDPSDYVQGTYDWRKQ